MSRWPSSEDTKDYFKNLIEPELGGFLGFVLIFLALLVCSHFIIQNVLGTSLGILSLSAEQGFVLLTFLIFSTFFIWLLNRRFAPFNHQGAGILISFNELGDGTNKELNNLYSKICIIIDENKELGMKIRRLPKRFKISDHNDAVAIRIRKNASLVIWGDAEYGNFSSQKEYLAFSPIRFTYVLPSKYAPIFNNNFKNLILGKRWSIDNDNNVIERMSLAKNVEEVALYVCGINLLFIRNNKELALLIFKKLLFLYQENELQPGQESTKNIVLLLVLKIYNDKIYKLKIQPNKPMSGETINESNMIIRELRELGLEAGALLLEAQIFVNSGDIDKARNIIHKGVVSFPEEVSFLISAAYIEFYDDNPTSGFNYLMKSLGHKNIGFASRDMISVITWYERTLKMEDIPHRENINLPLGLLYDFIGDKKNAKDSLVTFKNECFGSRFVNAKMRYEVNRRIKKLTK